jgi:hypothetical protein
MTELRVISKYNRLARLINTQFIYSGQTGKFIGSQSNLKLIREAWWVSNTIKESTSKQIDIICASGKYSLEDRGSLLIQQGVTIHLNCEAKKYLRMVEELTKVLDFTHQTKLSQYITESK